MRLKCTPKGVGGRNKRLISSIGRFKKKNCSICAFTTWLIGACVVAACVVSFFAVCFREFLRLSK